MTWEKESNELELKWFYACVEAIKIDENETIFVSIIFNAQPRRNDSVKKYDVLLRLKFGKYNKTK